MANSSSPTSLARISAIVVGAPLSAFALGVVIIALFPGERGLGLAIGFHLMIPLWVTLACTLPLLKSGARAWGQVLAVVIPAALVLIWRGLG